jgi:hypothetical protein
MAVTSQRIDNLVKDSEKKIEEKREKIVKIQGQFRSIMMEAQRQQPKK